jgi:type II secretory pathway pseudopilin PulG
MREPETRPHWQCLLVTLTPVVLALVLVGLTRPASQTPAVREKHRSPASTQISLTANFGAIPAMNVQRQRTAQRRGLTLIELVVVLFILIALAALVIPRLSFLQDQAKNAAGAAGAADLMNNIEVYRASSGAYPQKFDSLLDVGGASIYDNLWKHPGFTPPIVPSTLGAGGDFTILESFGHAFSNAQGNYYLEDQVTTTGTDPNFSGTSLRAITFSGSDPIAVIAPRVAAPASEGDVITNAIWQAAGYPVGIDNSGITLLAVGVGPNCSAVGQTLSKAPQQVAQDPSLYGRFIAVFALYGQGSANPGKAAQLATVIDSFYQPIDSNIASFKSNGPSNNVTVPTP